MNSGGRAGLRLGLRGVYRRDAQIIRSRRFGLPGFGDGVDGQTNSLSLAQQFSGSRERQVFLAQMNAIGLNRHRDVHPVIDQKKRPAAEFSQNRGLGKQFRGGGVRASVLDRCHTGGDGVLHIADIAGPAQFRVRDEVIAFHASIRCIFSTVGRFRL